MNERAGRPSGPDIDELIELAMAKLAELDEEARAALAEGDRRGYLSTMRVIALFLKTNASLMATRQKLRASSEKRFDLAMLLSSVKKVVVGLIWRRRKRS